MEEIKDEEMYEKELNFLKGELKKIDDEIKTTAYGGNKDYVEAQTKLWELREKIKGKIDEFIKSHQAGENKPKRKGTFMSA